jgi:hypothetical protein
MNKTNQPAKHSQTHARVFRKVLMDILPLRAPSYPQKGKPNKVIDYCWEYLTALGREIETDKRANLYVIGNDRAIVAHTDAVGQNDGKSFEPVRLRDGTITSVNNRRPMGGDDKVGVAIALTLSTFYPELSVLLFAAEECGCVGSSAWCSARLGMDGWKPGFDLAIQCDRKGCTDLVADACGIELANKDAAKYAAMLLPHRDLVQGGLTDVCSLAQDRISRNAFNLSAGYYNPHSNHEFIVYSHALQTYYDARRLLMMMPRGLDACRGGMPYRNYSYSAADWDSKKWGSGQYDVRSANGHGGYSQTEESILAETETGHVSSDPFHTTEDPGTVNQAVLQDAVRKTSGGASMLPEQWIGRSFASKATNKEYRVQGIRHTGSSSGTGRGFLQLVPLDKDDTTTLEIWYQPSTFWSNWRLLPPVVDLKANAVQRKAEHVAYWKELFSRVHDARLYKQNAAKGIQDQDACLFPLIRNKYTGRVYEVEALCNGRVPEDISIIASLLSCEAQDVKAPKSLNGMMDKDSFRKSWDILPAAQSRQVTLNDLIEEAGKALEECHKQYAAGINIEAVKEGVRAMRIISGLDLRMDDAMQDLEKCQEIMVCARELVMAADEDLEAEVLALIKDGDEATVATQWDCYTRFLERNDWKNLEFPVVRQTAGTETVILPGKVDVEAASEAAVSSDAAEAMAIVPVH